MHVCAAVVGPYSLVDSRYHPDYTPKYTPKYTLNWTLNIPYSVHVLYWLCTGNTTMHTVYPLVQACSGDMYGMWCSVVV